MPTTKSLPVQHRLLALAFVSLLACLGSRGAAQDLGNRDEVSIPAKASDHVLQHPASDAREGGETIADALPIPSLPFNDTGATCDNVDDYDAVCPYTGSTSPDVVYSYYVYEPTGLTVDLCGSSYDTKVYILDADQNVLACNDDFYSDATCGYYVSLIDAAYVDGDQTVYIVIDGYGGDCGEYELEVTAFTGHPCVYCPADAMLEGEPELMDGYQDAYNGGCNSSDLGTPFQDLGAAGADGELSFCGVSGWYDDGFRDTDWFTAVLDAEGTGLLSVTIDADQGTYLFELFPQDCSSVAVAQLVQVYCSPTEMQVVGAPGDLVWLWVGPDEYYPPAGFTGHEYDYVMQLIGLNVVATRPATWSRVKGMYR